MRRLVRLSGSSPLPLAAALTKTSSDRSVDVIVVCSEGEPVPEAALLELIGGDPSIGAVVPTVLSADGIAIAGSGPDEGWPAPRGAGDDGGRFGSDGVTDADRAGSPAVAVARSVAVRAAWSLPPATDEPRLIVAALISAARESGKRILSEPTWGVRGTLGAARSSGRVAMAGSTTRGGPLLVITGFLPGSGRPGDSASEQQLLASLTEACGPTQLTVMALDGFGARERALELQAEGIDVALPPRDWDLWLNRRWGHFSHVFICQSALDAGMTARIDATQPQAARILFLESLPFREIEAWRSATPAEESPGLEQRWSESIERAIALAGSTNAIWCETEADARFLQGLLPGHEVAVVARSISRDEGCPPWAARSGVAVWAAEEYDIGSANEEAAQRFIEDVLPELRRRDPSLVVDVITNQPSPMMVSVASAAGARLVPFALAAETFRTARLLVVHHAFGDGGRHALFHALSNRTPFVASPLAAAGLDLTGVAPLGVFGLVEDVVCNAWRLLTDETRWTMFAEAIDRLADTGYSPERRDTALTSALAAVGLVRRGDPEPRKKVPTVPHKRSSRPAVRVPLRPPGVDWPDLGLRLDPQDGRERYWLWAERYGPTEEALAAFHRELTELEYQPTISIMMPVYNTDPYALRAAIDSVRSQVYGHWQLCIADDGSTRADTATVLDELRGDPAVSIIRLPGNSGISGATNAALSLAEGEFVAFLDHDDVYKPHALVQMIRWLNADPSLDLIYSDEDKLDEHGQLIDPHIKPDWSPDHLMSNNYVCHLTVVRRSLLDKVGGLRSEYDGSQDYDLILRLTEQTNRIAHIPEPLYSWRIIPGSAAADADAKPYAWRAGRAALADALARRGYDGTVEFTSRPGIYRARYTIPGKPRVSIIVPTRDRVDLLKQCVESVYRRSTYKNFEFVVLDNQSSDPETLAYLARFPGRVLRYPHRFNYPRMMNATAAAVDCDALLFLNNDIEVISPDWIEALLEHAMRPEVGAVGGRLYFQDGRIQHEGVLVGVVGWAANADHAGYWARGDFTRNASAVTGACMMVRPSVYSLVGGMDERLRVSYNDVDLCLRIRQAGFEVVYTPHAELYHYESATRSYHGAEGEHDGRLFDQRWHPRDNVDPYYSPLFERDRLFVVAL